MTERISTASIAEAAGVPEAAVVTMALQLFEMLFISGESNGSEELVVVDDQAYIDPAHAEKIIRNLTSSK